MCVAAFISFIYVTTVNECVKLLNPANGQVSTSSTAVGGTATYTCNQGYTLAGSPMRTCESDRTWSGATPICDGKSIFFFRISDNW